MPDPSDLLAVARLLSSSGAPPTSDAQLRRAVSTAYYALFHKLLRCAAMRFAGPNTEATAAFRLLYRSFEHGHMKQVCEDISVVTLRAARRRQLGRDTLSQDVRDFASDFVALQDARQLADYDPAAVFQPSDVASQVDAAEVAMAAFDRVAPEEQADVLALLMVKPRG